MKSSSFTSRGFLAGSDNKGSSSHRESSHREFQAKCVYCTQSHWSDQCLNYSTLQARKETLRRFCYNCLQRGHTLKDCTKDRVCAHCGSRKNHHHNLQYVVVCLNKLLTLHTVYSNVDKAEDTTTACANQESTK